MSCGASAAPAVGVPVEAGDQAVIEGVVADAGAPVDGAYVRLLDSAGEFVAELPTGPDGRFRFFAAPGSWTVRALAAAGAGGASVVASRGAVASVEVALSAR